MKQNKNGHEAVTIKYLTVINDLYLIVYQLITEKLHKYKKKSA